jgi:hypothetical protein
MAKKIRLDFSKVEERSGWNTRGIPEGLHKMKIEAVQITEAQDGTDMWVYALVPADARYKTRRFPFYCKIQQNQLWKLRDLFVAAGITVPKKAVQLDPEAPIGKFVAAEVEDESGQYAGRSSVNATYGLDILDEEDSQAEDEDDEEYDEEAEDEEYEEEDEDEEDEDLEALTLAELRKRAKGLGIDTAGLKKADLIESIIEEESGDDEEDEDEDDLDDEDLDDEELEDDDEDEEEEEEAPAPKRRAAPARKAAPTKRKIARR